PGEQVPRHPEGAGCEKNVGAPLHPGEGGALEFLHHLSEAEYTAIPSFSSVLLTRRPPVCPDARANQNHACDGATHLGNKRRWIGSCGENMWWKGHSPRKSSGGNYGKETSHTPLTPHRTESISI